jgi:hypothetical protein
VSRAWVFGLASFLALVASSSFGDFKETYKKGLEAVESKKWTDVARLMQQAIAEKPREGESIRLYGQRFETYLPHYYLGIALQASGDCEGAVKALRESEGQGAIRKSGEYKNLTKVRASCEAQMAKLPPSTLSTPSAAKATGPDPSAVAQATREAEADIKRAEDSLATLAPLESDPQLAKVWGQDPGLGPTVQKARDHLAQASARLGEGRAKQDLGLLQQARVSGKHSADLAEGVKGEAGRKRSELRSAQFKAEEEARRKTVATATPTPAPPVAPPVTATSGPTLAPKASPASTPGLASTGAPGPPQPLLAAAQAYFSGQYQTAASLLPAAESFGGKAAVHGVALRAAARYAAFLSTGEKDQSLLDQARTDIATLRRLDRGFTLDSQAFSPRVVAFFRGAR